MNKPSLLLCDEPTGNLDASASRAIGDLLLEAAKGMGAVLVVVTHNLSLALRFGRLARMNDGRLEEDARP